MNTQNLHSYKDADDKAKLGILRSELRRYIATIQGFSSALKSELSDSQHIAENPTWMIHIDKVIEAVNMMDEVVESLTG